MILISDFDGTIYDNNYENNIKAVNDFVKKGNTFVIATGRSINSIKEKIDGKLDFSYIICNDGAMIFDYDYHLIYRKDIALDIAKHIFIELKNSIYVGNPKADLGYAYRNKVLKNTNTVIARIIDKNKASHLMVELVKKHPKVNAYISNNYLNFTDKTVNKSNAVKWLSKILKEKPKNMYMIGNNINDIKMCKLGKGYAVEKSNEKLKKVCLNTVNSVEDLIKKI